MGRHLSVLCGALISVAVVGFSQVASGVSGTDVILARQASLDMSSITFHAIVDAMKAGREAKSQGYQAVVLAKWAKTLPRLFPPGSGQGETSVSTQALPLIWRDGTGFALAAANYVNATSRLTALAAANDTQGFTAQLEKVDQACGSCHAKFKEGAQGPPKR
jgi:cytochrome c556